MKCKKISQANLSVILKLTLDILELKIKSKKKVLGFLNGSFLSSLLEGRKANLVSLKREICKKGLKNSGLDLGKFS